MIHVCTHWELCLSIEQSVCGPSLRSMTWAESQAKSTHDSCTHWELCLSIEHSVCRHLISLVTTTDDIVCQPAASDPSCLHVLSTCAKSCVPVVFYACNLCAECVICKLRGFHGSSSAIQHWTLRRPARLGRQQPVLNLLSISPFCSN